MIGSLILVLLGWATSASPEQAIRLAALVAGRPDLGAELVKICRAESGGCRALGAHGTRHNPAGEIYYRAGLRSRRLRPDECPAHGPASAATWGPRGPLGLAAAYHAFRVHPCAPAEIVDVPLVSAALGLAHLIDLERRGFCTPRARRAAWRSGIAGARDHRCRGRLDRFARRD